MQASQDPKTVLRTNRAAALMELTLQPFLCYREQSLWILDLTSVYRTCIEIGITVESFRSYFLLRARCTVSICVQCLSFHLKETLLSLLKILWPHVVFYSGSNRNRIFTQITFGHSLRVWEFTPDMPGSSAVGIIGNAWNSFVSIVFLKCLLYVLTLFVNTIMWSRCHRLNKKY